MQDKQQKKKCSETQQQQQQWQVRRWSGGKQKLVEIKFRHLPFCQKEREREKKKKKHHSSFFCRPRNSSIEFVTPLKWQRRDWHFVGKNLRIKRKQGDSWKDGWNWIYFLFCFVLLTYHSAERKTEKIVWFGWFLWHVNQCKLFKAKSSLYTYIILYYIYIYLSIHFVDKIFKGAWILCCTQLNAFNYCSVTGTI